MTLRELIDRFRTLANDKVEPYFWADDEIVIWLNDAQEEAVLRGRLLHSSNDVDMCRIAVLAGESVYSYDDLIYEFDAISFHEDFDTKHECISLVSMEELSRYLPDWETAKGKPQYALQDDKRLVLYPMPDKAGTLFLSGYYAPKNILGHDDDVPEIHVLHHKHLLDWVLYQAFSIPDTEMFDPNRAKLAEERFTRYFGEQTDSDLRRITREDTPHTVKAFWI